MITGPIIAEIAALVGEPARATMMSSLLDGRALTAGELARAARITPQTASTHLAKLTAAGLLSMVQNGRHRHFRLASPAVGDMLDGIVAVALLKRPRRRPLSREACALDEARICYDHLAGRLSVALTDAFVARKYLVLHGDAAVVTTAGVRAFTHLGIELPRPRRARCHVGRLCLDWTERRPHIAGVIGAAMARRYFDLGWMERMKDSQAVSVTPAGRRAFLKTFGVHADEPGDRRTGQATLR
ncbi:MAG TPA: helix-turn-helix transcriptional regulator [Methylomirabilota bacterium]|nr:helix-turn-helix transcriptional regulator [Methylomirabilota bacterium]